MLANELIDTFCFVKHIDTLDSLIIKSAILYAEHFQHKPKGFYNTHQIPPKTEQAIILIVVHMTSNSDYSIWNKVDALLRFNIS